MQEKEAEYDYGKLKEVGRVSYGALQHAKTLVRAGARVSDVCEGLEEYMRNKGALPAFPVNISINQNAAHYTASINDTAVFTNNDLVKVVRLTFAISISIGRKKP